MKQRDVDRLLEGATRKGVALATKTERERCAQIADDYKQRALQDGMLMPAAVGKIIAEAIRATS